jgi:P-type Cu2+ transporter
MKQLAACPSKIELNQGTLTVNVKTEKLTPNYPKVSYQIIHATPGRVRIRLPRIVYDQEYARTMQTLTDLDVRLVSIRVKPAAASVTICYAPGLVSKKNLHSYLDSLIQKATEARGLSTQEPEEESSYWSALKLPTLAIALSLLSGPFGLAIPSAIVRGSIILASLPIGKRAIISVFQERKLNSDFLDFTAIAIVTAQSHFLTSCSMITLIQLGEAIRERTARSSHRQTLDLLGSLSRFVWVERNGEKQQIPIDQVLPEDTVIVYPGEQIPVDGHILRGRALIDQQKLTGESMPVVRSEGQEVYASTLVREGQIYILAERVGNDTRAGRTIELIQGAPIHDTRMENYVAKIADRSVIPTILLSAVVFALTRNPARTASVLTIDFATGIRVSVPTTVMAAMTAAARRGILIRCGRALELLAEVDAIVFDKTGTLTQGDVAIVGIKAVNSSISSTRLLELAASAEQRITHPVAEAIVRYALSEGVTILSRENWHYNVGLGISAEIDTEQVLVGSKRYLIEEGINLERLYQTHPDLLHTGHPTVYIASNGQVQGAIEYDDPLRLESQEVVQTLRETFGLEIYLLTGDSKQRANVIGQELDIPPDQIYGEAFPEEKAQIVQKLRDRGKNVLFVGDGINDSAALAYADVSVSFQDGSDVARETADVVLMRNDLRDLVEAMAIARYAKQIIHQNIGIVSVPNLLGLAFAGTVGINPMTATLINNGSGVIAGINGLRPMLTGSMTDNRRD